MKRSKRYRDARDEVYERRTEAHELYHQELDEVRDQEAKPES